MYRIPHMEVGPVLGRLVDKSLIMCYRLPTIWQDKTCNIEYAQIERREVLLSSKLNGTYGNGGQRGWNYMRYEIHT
jgi:hypothetical protein